ncbi:uncharacterized protein MELLADRAFT_106614 [Melampsora larici-populina 98AG31]|uniref:Uncharacterized protein n=1 Tax=Melampsora larici-populina (strain 98AG31 / pathotype 3-4-7) TaxID=747676 RepID=F4RM28_MELLP|nr:uncharacterized protein MELLADRAFT_106614 [Melampsora larici-populina 98AG31]EGG06648.1 hypothetical protein MELLADRAFT_106614 [Melampsora larici-populina 98AG31]
MADLTLQQLIDSGHSPQMMGKLTLFATKLAILLAGAWVHLVGIFVVFYLADVQVQNLLHLRVSILSDLNLQARTYDSTNYRPMDILLSLMRARQLVVYRVRSWYIVSSLDRIARLFRLGILLGLCDLAFLGIIYLPALIISLGSLRRRAAEATFAAAIPTEDQDEHFARIEARLKEEYIAVIAHSAFVYLFAIMFIPVMSWQLTYRDPTFLRNKTWLTVTQIGLHGPFAIGGNCIEFVMNRQASRLLLKHRAENIACRYTSTKGSSMELMPARYLSRSSSTIRN